MESRVQSVGQGLPMGFLGIIWITEEALGLNPKTLTWCMPVVEGSSYGVWQGVATCATYFAKVSGEAS